MTDCPTPPGAGGGPLDGEPEAPVPSAAHRVRALWHRIRSGEDPWAFGAVVVVAALAAGGLWFWAGARHGGVAVASASPGAPHEPAGAAGGGLHDRPGDGGRQPPGDGRAGPGADEHGRGGGDFEAGEGGAPGGPAGRGPETSGPPVAVHVAGAVAHPGLYHLPAGARVADAVATAGGSLARADLDRLNLAARLADGQRIYVVRRGESPPPAPAASGLVDGAAGDDATTGAPDPAEPVDLNAAGLAGLDGLPGVGPATARAILEERGRLGGFRSTRDLLRVPGIGEGRFARLKDHVRV
ncbi:MAG TPA: helix-hairpin-helix domain-containing protein [Acidimicrobiia bacterium]|nr:helix-hairpin-helix domain-containing protein [Acidimicrobiia bacterium]